MPVENDRAFQNRQAARRGLADIDLKLKPIIAADPRAAQLIAEATEIMRITDKASRRAKLLGLSARASVIRADALKKAGVDLKVVETKVGVVKATQGFAKVIPHTPPGSVIGTATPSSFPLNYSFKLECPDASDTWDFSGAKVRVHARSAIADHDCAKVLAGHGVSVAVPAGTKSMRVIASAAVDLDVVTFSFGAFAESAGMFGIRVSSPTGATLDNFPVGVTTVPVPVIMRELKRIHAANAFPNPVPVTTDGWASDLQEGDADGSSDFAFPGNPGPSLDIFLYTGGWVDADLQGLASVTNDMTPKALKVLFFN